MNQNIPQDVKDLMKTIQDAGYEIYLVGGCVRDFIMGREPHDWDMCSNATPEQLTDLFQKHHFGMNPKGLKFGTATAIFRGNEYEITTYRKEAGYQDGRHPSEVSYVSDIHTDLSRRDFTINAIAYNPLTQELVDDFHGIEDIQNGIIRTINNPYDRFEEDALRVLRALRFAIKFEFDIDPDTLQAMLDSRTLQLLDSISKERITQELCKILSCGKPVSKWFLKAHDILFQILPALKPCYLFEQNNKYHKHDVYEHMLAVTDNCKTTDPIIKLAGLFHDIGKPNSYSVDEEGHGHFYGHPDVSRDIVEKQILPMLRLTRAESEMLLLLVKYHDMAHSLTPKAIKRSISKFGVDFMDRWFILKQADIDDHLFPNGIPDWARLDEVHALYQEILNEEPCFSRKDLAVNGNDIKQHFQIKEGKEIGRILQFLFDMVLSGEIPNEKEVLLAEADKFYAKGPEEEEEYILE